MLHSLVLLVYHLYIGYQASVLMSTEWMLSSTPIEVEAPSLSAFSESLTYWSSSALLSWVNYMNYRLWSP